MMSEAAISKTGTPPLCLAFAACLVLVGSGLLWASSVDKLTDADLVKYATLICEGRVADIRCEWNAEHNQIHTIVTLSVKTVLKGKLASNEKRTMTLRLLGGRVGDKEMVVVDGPVFKKGEDVILFLDRDRCPLMPIVGLFQGKVLVETDEKTKTKTVKGRRTTTGASVSRDEFIANVRRLMKGEKSLIQDEGPEQAGDVGIEQAQEFRLRATGNQHVAPHVWPAPFYHWDLREFPVCRVPWVMGLADVPDLDANGTPNESSDRQKAVDTFRSAFDSWAAVTPSKLQFLMYGRRIPAGDTLVEDSNNVLAFTGTLPHGTNATASYHRNPSTGVFSEVDIIFNNFGQEDARKIWVFKSHGDPLDRDVDDPPEGDFTDPITDVDWNGNGIEEIEIDLLTVALHETGHFSGLGHCAPDGNGATNNPNHPVMERYWKYDIGPRDGGRANQILKDQDRDGCNFLYCPDMGDSPNKDNAYSVEFTRQVHGSGTGRILNGHNLPTPYAGPVHKFGIKERQVWRNFTYEWLGTGGGSNVSSECQARGGDGDAYDDGVQFDPYRPVANIPLDITVNVQTAVDAYGNSHDYAAHNLFVNLWVDTDTDLRWEPSERAISNAPLAGAGQVQATILFPYTTENVWVRARLDWGEGAGTSGVEPSLSGHEGPAQFGEVEDWRLRPHIDPEVCTPEPGYPPDPNVPDPNDPNDPNNDPNWTPAQGGQATLGPGQTTLIRLENQPRPRSLKILEIWFTGDGAEDIRVTGVAGHSEGGGKSSAAKVSEIHLPGWTIYQFAFEPQPGWELLRITNTGSAPCTFTVKWMSTCMLLGHFDYSQENKIVIEEMNMLYDGIMATVEVDAVAFFHDEKYAIAAEFFPFEDDGTWTGQFTTENPDTCEPMPQGGWIWNCEPQEEGIWEGEKFQLSLTTEDLAGGTYRVFVHDRIRETWFEFLLEANGCILVDDFESYVDDFDLWAAWEDGSVNNTGSTIFLQTDPIYAHSGTQAMGVLYKNAPEPHYSEVDHWYGAGQDWTAGGVKALSLWFYGDTYNDANEAMYVELQDVAGRSAAVPYDGDANDLENEEWQRWLINLQDFVDTNDVNLADIARLTIGLGDGNEPAGHAGGLVHFDDIKLCPSGCVGAYSDLDADISGPDGEPDCAVNYWDIKTMAEEWLTPGLKADLFDDDSVNLKDLAVVGQEWLEERLWPSR